MRDTARTTGFHRGPPTILTPSPCNNCHKHCKGERCPGWVQWFSESWTQVRELFR